MKKTHFKFLSFWVILGLLAALTACGGEPALPAVGSSTDAATEAVAPAESISLQLLQE